MKLQDFLKLKEPGDWLSEEETQKFLEFYHSDLKNYFNSTYRRKFCLDCFSLVKSGKNSKMIHKNLLLCKSVFGIQSKPEKYFKKFKLKFLQKYQDHLVQKNYMKIENGKFFIKTPFLKDKPYCEGEPPKSETEMPNQEKNSVSNSSKKSISEKNSTSGKSSPIDVYKRSRNRMMSRSRSRSQSINQSISRKSSIVVKKPMNLLQIEDLEIRRNEAVLRVRKLKSQRIESQKQSPSGQGMQFESPRPRVRSIMRSRGSFSSQRIRSSPGFRSMAKSNFEGENNYFDLNEKEENSVDDTRFFTPKEVAKMINFEEGIEKKEEKKVDVSVKSSSVAVVNMKSVAIQTYESLKKRREVALSPIKFAPKINKQIQSESGSRKKKRSKERELGYRSILTLYDEVKKSKTAMDQISNNVKILTQQMEGIKSSLLEYMKRGRKRKKLKTENIHPQYFVKKKSSKIKPVYLASKAKLEDMKSRKYVIILQFDFF